MENEFVFVFLFFFYSYQKCIFISLKCDLVFCFVFCNYESSNDGSYGFKYLERKITFCSMKIKNEM